MPFEQPFEYKIQLKHFSMIYQDLMLICSVLFVPNIDYWWTQVSSTRCSSAVLESKISLAHIKKLVGKDLAKIMSIYLGINRDAATVIKKITLKRKIDPFSCSFAYSQ